MAGEARLPRPTGPGSWTRWPNQLFSTSRRPAARAAQQAAIGRRCAIVKLGRSVDVHLLCWTGGSDGQAVSARLKANIDTVTFLVTAAANSFHPARQRQSLYIAARTRARPSGPGRPWTSSMGSTAPWRRARSCCRQVGFQRGRTHHWPCNTVGKHIPPSDKPSIHREGWTVFGHGVKPPSTGQQRSWHGRPARAPATRLYGTLPHLAAEVDHASQSSERSSGWCSGVGLGTIPFS